MKKITLFGIIVTLLVGCSSSGDKDDQLALLAQNRALLLTNDLPYKAGPLSIMRANAHENVIEIMMIYNNDEHGAKSTQAFTNLGTQAFCHSPDVRENLKAGLVYRIKIRNPRGQLMVDQMLTAKSCNTTPTQTAKSNH